MLGAAFWGYVADRFGRKVVFIATILNFWIATGIMAFTPEMAGYSFRYSAS